MTEAAPADLLLEVLETPPDALSNEAVAWLAGAVKEYVRTGDSVESALGVKRYSVLLVRRNQHLRRAWSMLSGSPWPRSEALARRVRDFESRRWPRVRHESQPPERFDAVDRVLFAAFRLGLSIPATGRALHGICATEKHIPTDFGNGHPSCSQLDGGTDDFED